jgi:hypothetical protein
MPETDSFGERRLPHLSIDRFVEKLDYTFPSRRQERRPLRDDYAAHAEALLVQLAQALSARPTGQDDSRILIEGIKLGRVVEVHTMPPAETSRATAVKLPSNLDFPAQEISVLRTTRNENRSESALLFIPDEASDYLRMRIENYGRNPGNQQRPDVERFEVIEEVRAVNLSSLFTGDVDLANAEVGWWELWIRQPRILADRITSAAVGEGIDVHSDRLFFPDTTVIFLHSSAGRIASFAALIPGAITEVRKATGTIEIFLSGGQGVNQHEWVAELSARVVAPPENSPVVCTLDTGISSGHPLISPGLRGAWAYDAAWGADDHHADGGHGTPLAGLVLHGDLEPLMNGANAIQLTHGVESMKLLPPLGFPATDPPSYGLVTQGAISSVESERPGVLRSFCLAVSTTDFPPHRPSTWSGALDQIAAGAMPIEAEEAIPASARPKRLIVVSTGNSLEGMMEDVLPCKPLEDPSQSWNALTVGGITRKDQPPPPPPALTPAVAANHRSPFSRGSHSLPDDLVPIKPEVLFEAGNMLADESGFCDWNPAVSLLSTGSDTVSNPLVPFWATSAAVGVAGNFVGQLQAALPHLWPETHRALTVDSARWPGPIRTKFIGRGAHWKSGSKAQMRQALREVGYGVPELSRAVMSARNDVTLVAQAEIQPYSQSTGGSAVFNEMHIYQLPWPTSALELLENEIVTMKVTLSYFIEPNLTGRAATRPDTYRSFGLRFEMKKRAETDARFRRRISSSQPNDGTHTDHEQSYWLLGLKAIQAGSLHCDMWRGYAADLALHDAIAIYPVGGWWKSHAGQRRASDKARYSLVISISAPEQTIDLYSEISALVEAQQVQIGLSRD